MRLREYYEALGRFVDMFARAETAVTLTLRHYAKTSPEVSKIIFAGTRTNAGSKIIKQIANATGVSQELRKDLEDVFNQLGIITGVRNAVLHYGTEPESVAMGNAIVSDAIKAKGEPTTFPISPKALNEMTADLNKIIAHLDQSHLGKATADSFLGDPRLAAWRYKHPVPTHTPSKKGKGQR